MISREDAIAMLQQIGLTREEAERTLVSDRATREAIMREVQARIKREMRERSWAPMPLEEGPPLPRRFGIRWPWKE